MSGLAWFGLWFCVGTAVMFTADHMHDYTLTMELQKHWSSGPTSWPHIVLVLFWPIGLAWALMRR